MLQLRYLLISLGLSKQAMQKHLKELIEDDLIDKKGSAPKVFYNILDNFDTEFVSKEFIVPQDQLWDQADIDLVNKNFLQILSDGKIERGFLSFVMWCVKRKYDLNSYFKNYIW
jgi:hypothetical protein